MLFDGGVGGCGVGANRDVEMRMDAFGDGDEEYDDRVEMGERFGNGWGIL